MFYQNYNCTHWKLNRTVLGEKIHRSGFQTQKPESYFLCVVLCLVFYVYFLIQYFHDLLGTSFEKEI